MSAHVIHRFLGDAIESQLNVRVHILGITLCTEDNLHALRRHLLH